MILSTVPLTVACSGAEDGLDEPLSSAEDFGTFSEDERSELAGTGASSGAPVDGSAAVDAPASGGEPGTGGTMGGTGAMAGEDDLGNAACDGLASILPEDEFNALFPNRNAAYTWQGMIDAVEGQGDLIGFPLFAREGDCTTRKREVAAFLANVGRETGRLVYIEQINKSFQYCDQTKPYGCPAGSGQYFGRGPIQLSWNYNYRAASLALFGDERLLNNPGLVASDPAVAWATGFWFWMIGGAGGDGSYSPHSVVVAGEGFGETIRIINGFEECNGGTQPYAQEAVSQRICYYEKYAEALSVEPELTGLDCGTTPSDTFCTGISASPQKD